MDPTVAAVVTHPGQFWADVTRIGPVIAALLSGAAAVIGNHNKNKIQEVHVLVNGELHARLEKLDELTGRLQQVTEERDQAKVALAHAGTEPAGPVADVVCIYPNKE